MLHDQKSVKLDEHLSNRWKRYHDTTGESFSAYVKRLLDKYLPSEKATSKR